MKDIKGELKRDIPYSWIGRLSIVKMSILPNLIYRFNAVPIKILAGYFVDINKLILKFVWRRKRPRISHSILKEKNKVGDMTLSDFKTYKTIRLISYNNQTSVVLVKE